MAPGVCRVRPTMGAVNADPDARANRQDDTDDTDDADDTDEEMR